MEELRQQYEALFGPLTIYRVEPINVWHGPEETNVPCAWCRDMNVKCVYNDTGGPSRYFPHYYHICLSCGLIQTTPAYDAGEVSWEHENITCPFCHRHWV